MYVILQIIRSFGNVTISSAGFKIYSKSKYAQMQSISVFCVSAIKPSHSVESPHNIM